MPPKIEGKPDIPAPGRGPELGRTGMSSTWSGPGFSVSAGELVGWDRLGTGPALPDRLEKSCGLFAGSCGPLRPGPALPDWPGELGEDFFGALGLAGSWGPAREGGTNPLPSPKGAPPDLPDGLP